MHTVGWKFALLPVLALAPALAAQTASAPAAPAAPASTASGVKVDRQESFTVVGLTVRTNNAQEANGQGKIPALWERALQENALDQIPNRVSDGWVVVYSGYSSDNTGDYDYTLGVGVSSVGKLPEGFVARTVQAGRYAVLSSEQGPPQQVIPALWQRIAAMTPQELGGTRAYQTDFETYPPITDSASMQMQAHVGLK